MPKPQFVQFLQQNGMGRNAAAIADAFDKDNDGQIDVREVVVGMALIRSDVRSTHGHGPG